MVKKITDLSLEQRQAIADKAKAEGMTAEQVGERLSKAGYETQPIQTNTTTEVKPQITTDLATGQATEVETGKDVTPPTTATEVKTQETTTPTATQTTTPTETTEVKTEEKAPITSMEQFKAAGSTQDALVDFLENSPNITTTDIQIEGDKVTGMRDGVKYEWTIDDAGNPIRKAAIQDSNSYFTNLMNNVTETNPEIKNSTEYKNAVTRKIMLDKYSSMTSSELSSVMMEGGLLPGTQSYNDLKATNPTLLTEAENLYKLNAVNSGTTPSIEQSISNYITSLLNPQQTQNFSTLISENEDIKAIRDKLSAKEAEYNEILDQINNVEDDIEADLGDRSVSKSYKNYLVGERTKGLTRQANLLLSDLKTFGGQLQNITEDLKYDYEQSKADEITQLQRFQTAYGLYKDQQASAVSKWSKLNDGTLYNEVTGETKQVDVGATTDGWARLDDNTLYNKNTGEFRDKTGATSNDIVSNPNAIVDYSVKLRGREELQCGELVNDYWTKTTGSRAGMGDTLESKLDSIMSIGISDLPVAGGIFVSNPLGNDVGHTGIVQTVNADGSIDVLEANAGGSANGEKPVIKTYSLEEIANVGMIFSKSPRADEEKVPTTVADWGQNILKGKAKLSDIVNNPELRTQVSSYIANNKPVYEETDPMITSIDKDLRVLGDVANFEDDRGFFGTSIENLAEDVSGARQVSVWDSLTGQKQQYLRKIQTVLDSQALKNLIDVKNMGATFGSLTEKEMAILQKSSSALNASANRDEDGNITGFTMNESDFKRELTETLASAERLRNSLLGIEEQDLFDKYY